MRLHVNLYTAHQEVFGLVFSFDDVWRQRVWSAMRSGVFHFQEIIVRTRLDTVQSNQYPQRFNALRGHTPGPCIINFSLQPRV